MRPILVHAGPLQVHSYGVMVALATVMAGRVLSLELQRRAGRGDAAFALTLAALVGGFVGARVYFLIEHAGQIGMFEALSGAGFTWYGGVLGGATGVLAVAWRRGVPTAALLGAAGPALSLGYGVGRIACQLAGDGTYGTASSLPWAMSYPHGEVPTSVRVHPTPVYETLTSLVIFTLLWRLRRRTDPVRLFGLYLVLAGLERFLVEFIRRNHHVLIGLSQPQLFALTGTALGVLLLAAPLPHAKAAAARRRQRPATP